MSGDAAASGWWARYALDRVARFRQAIPRVPLLLFVVVLVGLVLRVVVSRTVSLGHIIDADSPGYLHPAMALARHGRFTAGPDTHYPEFFRTPAYPLFLAILSRLFGWSTRSLSTAQAVLSTVTIVGVFALARRWFGSVAIALGAALLAAVEPLQVWSSAEILTEALSAAIYVGLALTVTAAARAGSVQRWAVVGCVLAAATYVRPTTYYFPVVVFVALIVFAAATGSRRQAAVWGLAVLLPFVALVAPWQLRNHHETGSWRFSAVEAVNVYDYRAVAVVAHQTGQSFTRTRNLLDYLFTAAHANERQGVFDDHKYSEGLRILRAHPGAFAVTSAQGIENLVFGVKHVTLGALGLPEHGPMLIVAEAGLIGFYVLAAIGLVGVVRSRRSNIDWPSHVFVVALIVYTVLAAGNPRATARLRAPLMLLLCPYVAAGTAMLVHHRRERRG